MLRLYFDGDCDLCRRTVAALGRLDRRRRLRMVDFRREALDDPRLSPGALERRVHAIDRRARIFSGYAALAAAGREIPVLAPLAAVAAVPVLSALAERAYDVVAARRHLLWCGSSCAVRRADS